MFRSIGAASVVILTTAPVLSAQERFALVIDNSEYQAIASLADASVSAGIVAEGLKGMGYDVNVIRNSNAAYQNFSIAEHLDRLQAAQSGSVGMIYYAGHGVSQGGDNYLLPVNSPSGDGSSAIANAVNVSSLLAALPVEAANRSVIVIDCCVTTTLTGDTPGFAEMAAPAGNLVAYSAPANTASTTDGIFAQTLIDAMNANGSSIEAALAQVNAAQPIFISASAMAQPMAEETVAETTQESAPNDEESAWMVVKESTASTDVFAFIERYPDGKFAKEAKSLMIDLLWTELAANSPATETATQEPATPDIVAVTFSTPLTQAAPEIVGKTIEELIKGTPLFPPVEGLPESYWKTQECSNCHEWEQTNLCAQANTYLTDAGAENLVKQHPYGGTFKQNLRIWAIGGCE